MFRLVPATARCTYSTAGPVLALILLVPAVVSAEDQTRKPSHTAAPNFASVRESIRTRLVREAIPSLAAAVATNRQILWEEGFGWTDRERRVPAEQHTLYRLAAVTKPITGTALMILPERSRLDLDRPVNEYLGARITSPAWGPAKATARLIATHTAGLATHEEPNRGLSLDERMSRYAALGPPPGAF